MPRQKASPNTRRLRRTQTQARWRQRLATHQNQNLQVGQFINNSGFNSQQEQLIGDSEVEQVPLLTHEVSPTSQNNADSWIPTLDNNDENQIFASQPYTPDIQRQSSSLASRHSNRQSSSLAQSRISNYYGVSKSRSPAKTNSVASRLSRTVSVVINSTEHGHISNESVTETQTADEDDPDILIQDQLQRELSQSQEGSIHQPQVDIARELGQHLLSFHGCEIGTHDRVCQQHFQDPRRLTNHHSLSDLEALTSRLPDVISQPKPLEPGSVDRNSTPDWAKIFEGKHDDVGEGEEPEEEERIHVCLHKSEQEQRHRPMSVEFDVDSVLGYATSLAFAKQGLMINLAPQFHSNIQTNLHLYSLVSHDYGRGPRTVRVKLNKIPHYCLGYLTWQRDTQVYVFFPKQWHPDKPTNFPGKKDGIKHRILEVWTNELLLPAIARYVSSGIGQHMPSSWRQARLNAEARFNEANASRLESTSRHQMLYYPLQPQVLDLIWQEIQSRLEEPEYAIYRDAQLFFSSKNSKGIYKGNTLADVWGEFEARLDSAFDFRHLDETRFWFDLGKETICKEWCLPQQDLILNQSPASYLMRSCCLEAFYQWSCFGEPSSRAKKTLYVPAMLGESYDMTVEMSPGSLKRDEGWIFSQFYNSYKEMTDVAKIKPFRSRFLAQFAWDPKVRALLEREGGGTPVTAKKVKQGYCQSKSRLASALLEGQKKSFGVREEHRITLAFFYRIKERLETSGDWNQQPGLHLEQYPFWELSSLSYTTFLRYNANKFLYAIEWILATAPGGYVSYEHAKVISMLLQSVKYCYDTSPLAQESGLWRDRYQIEESGPFTQGMGLENTIKGSGYGWFLPKIDWERLTFLPTVTSEIRYNDLALYDHYRKRHAAVKDVKDDLKRLEIIGGWLAMYSSNRQILDLIIEFICTLVVQSFRKDVFRGIKEDIRIEFRDEALAGKVMLCQTSLKKILLPQEEQEYVSIHAVSANRAKIRTVQQAANFLWDFEDDHHRAQWATRSYRNLHQRALEILRIQCGAEVARRVHDGIKRTFILTNWVIPYPNETKFFQRGRFKERLWLSIYHRDLVSTSTAEDTIPFSQLCTHMNDTQYTYRHYLMDSKTPVRKYRMTKYMGGKWRLVEDKFGEPMMAIPGESKHFGYQNEVDMSVWAATLERLWQKASDDLIFS